MWRPNAVSPCPSGRLKCGWWRATSISNFIATGCASRTRFQTSNHPRSFVAYDRRQPDLPAGLWSSDPVGIVYHTTESHGAPFEAQQNQALKRQGESLLEFVRDKQAYHYVIDRFGRVHRIVAESDTANHAGKSVWADANWVYRKPEFQFPGDLVRGRDRRI